MKKNIINAIAASMLLLATGCSDYLDTTSPSVVDKEFVFSDVESARSALYYGYQTLQNNRSVHSVGYFWCPIWGSDIEDAQDTYSDGSAGCQEKTFYPGGTENYNIREIAFDDNSGSKKKGRKARGGRSSSGSVTVRKGDTLGAIAKRNHTTIGAIQRANGLKGTNIKAGQKLKMP